MAGWRMWAAGRPPRLLATSRVVPLRIVARLLPNGEAARRGRGGLSPSDMDRLNQMAGLMGGPGGGFPSPAARGRDFPPY